MLLLTLDYSKSIKRFTILLLFLLNSCSHDKVYIAKSHKHYHKVNKSYTLKSRRYKPFHHEDLKNKGYKERGIASWYKNNGHKMGITATGDFFNHNALTAAHRVLPFMSVVKVTNLKNNKFVNVIINDRGPFFDDRIIDVSERTADILDFKKSGITQVRIEYLPEETKRLLRRIKNKQYK